LILPDASCAACQAITSAFEGHNAGRLFRPIRRQFNMPSKRRGRADRQAHERETFLVKVDGRKVYLPSAEYPGLIVTFHYPLPDILLGIPPENRSFTGGVAVGILPEFGERLNEVRRKYGEKVEFPTSGSTESVGRLLAKIAHAYVAAEIGTTKFTPYLLGIIRNHDLFLMHHFIGSASGIPAPGSDLHDIDILPPDALGSCLQSSPT
jgi:hypothetical protein